MDEIWAFVEYSGEKILRGSQEALSEAVRQATKLGWRSTALVAGHQIPPRVLESIGRFGVDRALVCDEESFSEYSTYLYTDYLSLLLRRQAPKVLLLGGSAVARNLAPRLSARLGCGLVTEATYLHHQPDGFHVTRAAFRPHVSMIFSFWSPDLCMITLAPKVMEVERIGPVGRFAIETLGLRHRPLLSQKDTVKVERVVREMPSQMDLSDAEVVVAGGKGMQAGENFRLLEELADLLGGTVAATRMAVDMKWRSRDSMVGVTGKVVSPGLYVACGISGAIQHLMGMQSAETIIAINTDPNAPIFRVATLGIVGDAREVLPVMIDAFREARSDADRQENSA